MRGECLQEADVETLSGDSWSLSGADGDGGTSMRPWAQVKETHAGVVILLGDHAFKLKKPVDLGILDFTTLQARRAMCHKEVELNRRLAPDVCKGVGDVAGPDGRVWEHVVVMRRMPDERRLSALVRAGAPVGDAVAGSRE